VDAWLNHLVTSIEDAKDIDPGWECPEVRIFHSDTGAMVRRFEGGAAIPGWTEPKSYVVFFFSVWTYTNLT